MLIDQIIFFYFLFISIKCLVNRFYSLFSFAVISAFKFSKKKKQFQLNYNKFSVK